MNRIACVALLAMLMAVSATQDTHAGPLPFGVYELFDHGNGALGPDYGIRLDDASPPAGNGPTFSVSNVSGAGPVILTWPFASTTATITGTTVNSFTGETWDISYTITGITLDPNGFVASGGTGTLTYSDVGPAPVPSVLPLTGMQDNGGDAFRFLMDGHRIPGDNSTIVGRGWLEGGGNFNDFLVQATILEVFVPEPTSCGLAAIGMLALLRRRK